MWKTLVYLAFFFEAADSFTTLRPYTRRGYQTAKSKVIVVQTRKLVPFVIDQVNDEKEKVYREISKLCIDIFFNEEAERKQSELKSIGEESPKNSPWRELKLAYLRNLQCGDLRGRKFSSEGSQYVFLIARRVISTDSFTGEDDIIDPKLIFNSNVFKRERIKGNDKYKRTDIIGFVQVNEKSIALGAEKSKMEGKSFGESNAKRSIRRKRPILSNLSVKEETRGSGVGSRLLEACEKEVRSWSAQTSSGKHTELILEVEEVNTLAQKFYERRGYQKLYSDPTSRRYDLNGLFLRKVPTTKITYAKDFMQGRSIRIGVLEQLGQMIRSLKFT